MRELIGRGTGAVRPELVARQLDAHLPGRGRVVVDVGGGAGRQAIRLARLGYDVLEPGAFEVVLCHAVLPYVEERDPWHQRFTDHLSPAPPGDDFADVLQAERRAGARLLHLVVRGPMAT